MFCVHPAYSTRRKGEIFEEKKYVQVEDEPGFFEEAFFLRRHENLNQKFGYRKTTYKSWSLFA